MWISFSRKDEAGPSQDVDPAIVKLLAHRFGDGMVYLRGQEERALYEQAKTLGLINCEGYLTPAGRDLISVFETD